MSINRWERNVEETNLNKKKPYFMSNNFEIFYLKNKQMQTKSLHNVSFVAKFHPKHSLRSWNDENF